MRQSLLLMCMGLAAGGVGAESRTAADHGPQPTLEQLMQVRAADPRFREAEGSRPLFFRLEAPAREVTFSVSVAGRPYLQERVTLSENSESAPAVELLARDAAQLERLRSIAANKALPIEVTVIVDGKDAARFDFQEFVNSNRELKTSGLRPVTGTSEIQRFTPDRPSKAPADGTQAAQPDGPCEDQCYWQKLDCYDVYCNGGCNPICPVTSREMPPPDECWYCDEQYNNCLANCTCTDPRSVTTYTTSELVGYSWTWWDCFRDWWDPYGIWGYWYQQLELLYKFTTYRRTEYCDGTVVTEPIDVAYGWSWCNWNTHMSCYLPFMYPYNTCN